MAAKSEMQMSSSPEFMLPILDDVINDLQIQIKKGKKFLTVEDSLQLVAGFFNYEGR